MSRLLSVALLDEEYSTLIGTFALQVGTWIMAPQAWGSNVAALPKERCMLSA